jgi:hypothetical protein
VWIGAAGSTTHTHYDISENFYAQIYGVKRFVLFPPEETENLYLYPFLHPGAQQSQVSFDSPDYELFPRFKQATAVEVCRFHLSFSSSHFSLSNQRLTPVVHSLQAILYPGDVVTHI